MRFRSTQLTGIVAIAFGEPHCFCIIPTQAIGRALSHPGVLVVWIYVYIYVKNFIFNGNYV